MYVTSVSALSGAISYTYDSKDRLLSEVSALSGGFTSHYGYDAAGNLTEFKGASRSYNSDNQLSGTGYSFDGNGNPTTYGGSSITFDANDKAIAFGSAASAGYMAEGLRAWKATSGGFPTYYLYDGDVPIMEIGSSGTVFAVNTWGAERLDLAARLHRVCECIDLLCVR